MAKLVLTTSDLKNQIKDKLPSFAQANCLFTKKSFEQCTAESIAKYKALVFSGNSLLVLAGGLGVDDWAFSQSFKQIVSIEPSVELNTISLFNFNKLNINNITRLSTSAEQFLAENSSNFDTIYIDPDRRTEDKRQILLKDHLPNCIELMPVLKKMANTILIKCSPLYDYEQAFKELDNIQAMYALSRNGEMKELLLVCGKNTSDPKYCLLHAVDIKQSQIHSVTFKIDDPIDTHTSYQGKYLYEAGASVVKLRQHLQYATQLHLGVIDRSVPYFNHSELIDNFNGRTFEILYSAEFSAKSCIKYLKEQGISKINLKVRGLPYSTEALRQSLKIKEGGEEFLFVLPCEGKARFFYCQKVSN